MNYGRALMSVLICASPYTPQTGPIWACYLGLDWVLYGRSHMGMTVWDSYGSNMGVSIWVTRIHPTHPTLGPYMIAIWSPHGSFMGVSLCDPYGSIMGLSIMGPVCDVYGLTHMGLVFGPHMGHLRVCPYEVGILAPHGSIMSLSIWTSPYTSLTGPIWACFLGPTWVLCGHVHMV